MEERPLGKAISGLMAAEVSDLSGQLSLLEVGALCEVADLYVGNDAGPTQVAAATGCSTLAIYGPSDPAYSRPYSSKADVVTLWRDLGEVEKERPFSWDIGVTAGQAVDAVDSLLERSDNREGGLEFLIEFFERSQRNCDAIIEKQDDRNHKKSDHPQEPDPLKRER